MAKKPAKFSHPEQLALYEKLVSFFPETTIKGASLPYTSCNGNMSSFMDAAGILAIRLDAGDRAAFMKKHKTELMKAHGTVMKEYVAVPPALLQTPARLKSDFAKSLAYVSTLKPKATKK